MSSEATPAPTMSRDTLGIALVLLSGTGVVLLPTSARLAFDSGSNLLTVAFARGVIAALILLAIVLLTGQRLRLPRDLFGSSLVVGVAGATFVFGMFGAIMSIEIGLAVLILYLYPMVLAAYLHCRGSARLRRLQWLWGLVTLAGLSIILGVRFEQINFTGVALAALAMLSAVVITLENVRVTERTGSLVSNLYMTAWGIVIFGVSLLFFGEILQPQTPLGWGGLLGSGIAYCIAWVGFFAGACIIGATRASMISLTEPLLAALAAWLIFGESLGPLQWVGFAIVLVALALFEKEARKAL